MKHPSPKRPPLLICGPLSDSSGRGEVSACVDLIRSGIREQLAEDPRGLDQLALLSMAQSAIGATEAPYDRMRQQRFAIKAEDERLAALARDPGYVAMHNPKAPASKGTLPFAGFVSLQSLYHGPMIHSVGAGVYLAAKHDFVQGQKQDLLRDPEAQHLRNAPKRAQEGLGFVETRGSSSKRAKSAAAAPSTGAADDTISVTSSPSSTVHPPPTKRTKTGFTANSGRLIPKTKGMSPTLTTEMLWPSVYNKLPGAPENAPAYFWKHSPEDISRVKAFFEAQ